MKLHPSIILLSICLHGHVVAQDDAVMMDELTVWADPTKHPDEDKPFTLIEPFKHYHVSKSGSPYIYAFTARPAFTGRDGFVDYTYLDGNGFTEQRIEPEIHWAFTQQIALSAELPYIYRDPQGASSTSDLGNLLLTPRASLLETEHFMIGFQTEFGVPTNNTLGSDTTITPGIVTWNDLGGWFFLNTEIGFQKVLDREEEFLNFNIALIKANSGHFAHTCVDGECDHSGDQSQFNYHLELSGNTPMDGDDRGDVSLNGLIGISYNLTEKIDARIGYLFPISTPHEFNKGFTTGLIYKF